MENLLRHSLGFVLIVMDFIGAPQFFVRTTALITSISRGDTFLVLTQVLVLVLVLVKVVLVQAVLVQAVLVLVLVKVLVLVLVLVQKNLKINSAMAGVPPHSDHKERIGFVRNDEDNFVILIAN